MRNSLFSLVRNWRNDRNTKKKCELLQKEGSNTLNAFQRVGKRLNIRFDVMFGTLLGAYREHSFIPHDDDIDMVCSIKDLNQQLFSTLREEGFELDRIYVSSDRVGVQLPMKYNGLTSDIYFMYDDVQSKKRHIILPYAIVGKTWGYSVSHNIFSAKDIIIPYNHKRMIIPFKDTELDVVANIDEILKCLYGDDYLSPKRNAHANPPVRYFDIGEKYYTCYPIDLFEESGLIKYIKKDAI